MLRGKYTALRAIEKSDLPALLEWRNRPEYRRFFREFRELSLTDQDGWYESLNRPDSRNRMFSIVRLSDGKLLGACGLCYLDFINRNADLSIYLGAEDLYIDEKLAPDTAVTLMRYGFEELNLHRVWSEIYSIDDKKKDFFRTLGFTQDGCFRESHWTEGRWVDSLFYSLLAPEFQAKHGKKS